MELEILTSLPQTEVGFTKSEIGTLAVNYVANVIDNGNILKSAEIIAQSEELIKLIKANPVFKNAVRDEIALNGKEYKTSSIKMELAETGTKYDYSQTGDNELLDLYATLEDIKAQIELREKMLKSLPLSGMDIITADGEPVHIYPPSKTSTSSYKITISK